MGRILPITFLAFLAMWILGFVSLVTSLLGRLLEGLGYFTPQGTMGLTASILTFAEWSIFLLAPLLLISLIALGLARGRTATRSNPGMGVNPSWTDWKDARVVVALTAWNDEEAIRMAVREFVALDCVQETIVVDNDSDDGTAEVSRDEGAHVVIEKNRGYGNVCIRGLREATKRDDANVVALAEGDMTFRASDIYKMLPYLEDVDMVVGTRTTYELTSDDSQMDWFMTWGNRFLALLIRLRYWDWRFLGKVRLTDVGCTFRILRREALARIVDKLHVGEDYFSPHMLISALRNDLSIIEVPIRFRKRVGQSKGASSSRVKAIRTGLQMLWEILT